MPESPQMIPVFSPKTGKTGMTSDNTILTNYFLTDPKPQKHQDFAKIFDVFCDFFVFSSPGGLSFPACLLAGQALPAGAGIISDCPAF